MWPDHAPGANGKPAEHAPPKIGPATEGLSAEDELLGGDGRLGGGEDPVDEDEDLDNDGADQIGEGRWAMPAWLRRVTFRTRVSVLVGLAVGIAIALTATVSYFAVSRQLQQQADTAVQAGVARVAEAVQQAGIPPASAYPFVQLQLRTGDIVQLLAPASGGRIQALSFKQVQINQFSVVAGAFFPVGQTARRAFSSAPKNQVPIVTLTASNGNNYRVAIVPVVPNSLAVMIGYPLRSLAFLRLMLILVGLGGVALAAALGWAVGRASMGPVENLTLAAEHVAETQDLSSHIDDSGNDELGRLAHSFNAMLSALSASRSQQAQLVSDAGHELRTPLTSLRTNIEVLMRARDLPGADRDELLSDVKAQLEELTTLVGDLVDLAREDERPSSNPELVDIGEVVSKAAQRAQRRAMSVTFEVDVTSGYVRGQATLLERAVMNVLDNAAKWSPAGGTVSVALQPEGGRLHLQVTDQGPGIASEDLPHVFERFYRAQSARSMPGSGLGLAIVKRVVASHGGDVEIRAGEQGGTTVQIWLPQDEGESQTEEGVGPDD